MGIDDFSHHLTNAFLRVKENHGGAGVDGVTIAKFERHLPENLALIESQIANKTYAPLPLLKILIDKGKGDGEVRALCIPAVRDRVVQTAVHHVIAPVLEREFEDCSFAYRKGRSVKQAVYCIKEYFDQGYRWVVDADIDAFFDSVDHDLLLAKARKYIMDGNILRLIELWIKAEVWDGKSISVLTKGIPQGSPLSPILANLFLDEFDEALLARGCRLVRYADDFIVLCKSPEKAEVALALTNKVLESLLLKLDEGDVVSFDEGFKYLGVTFLKSMIFVPFEKKKKEHKVLYRPPPFDMAAYLRGKRGSGIPR
jgi:group II intron reverse transcriptase/maturase